MAQLLTNAVHAVASDDQPKGPLKIGALETTAAMRLPPLLSAFTRAYPEVDLEFETGPTETLVGRVLDRGIEGAFVSGPVTHADLSAIPVVEEELVLVAPPEITDFSQLTTLLSGGRETKMLVFRTGCSYRQRLEAFLAAQGLIHVRRMELGTIDGIIGCVEAGMGVTMAPRIVAEPAHKQGRVSMHRLPDGAGHALTLFIYRSDNFATAAFTRFMECATTAFKPDGGLVAA